MRKPARGNACRRKPGCANRVDNRKKAKGEHAPKIFQARGMNDAHMQEGRDCLQSPDWCPDASSWDERLRREGRLRIVLKPGPRPQAPRVAWRCWLSLDGRSPHPRESMGSQNA